MYVIPKAGVPVPDPERGGLLPEIGANVPDTQYWFRRIAEGDVTEGEPPEETVSKKGGK